MGAAGSQRAVLGGGARPVLVSGGPGPGPGSGSGGAAAPPSSVTGGRRIGAAASGKERSVKGRGFAPCPIPDRRDRERWVCCSPVSVLSLYMRASD